MNLLDIIILIVAAAAVVIGLKRGLIKQCGAILSLVLGVVAARMFCHPVGSILASLTTSGSEGATDSYASTVVGGFVVFMIVYFGVRLAAGGLSKISHAAMLGPLDRIGGALFLAVEWLTVLSLFLNLWVALLPDSSLVKESTLCGGAVVGLVIDLAPKLLGIISSTAGTL